MGGRQRVRAWGDGDEWGSGQHAGEVLPSESRVASIHRIGWIGQPEWGEEKGTEGVAGSGEDGCQDGSSQAVEENGDGREVEGDVGGGGRVSRMSEGGDRVHHPREEFHRDGDGHRRGEEFGVHIAGMVQSTGDECRGGAVGGIAGRHGGAMPSIGDPVCRVAWQPTRGIQAAQRKREDA